LSNRRLLWIVARHEWRGLLVDRTVLLAMLGIAVAIGYAGAEGWSRARRWQASFDEYQTLQSIHLARFDRRAQAILEQSATGQRGAPVIHRREFSWGPHVPDFPLAWVPPKAALPPAPLAAAAVGDTETWFPAYAVGPFSREPLEAAEQPGNPLQSTLGRFDLAFVVVVLFPVFIIALTYDAFSAERDGGTLALVLAHPVARSTLIGGKLLARGSIAILWPCFVTAAVLLLAVAGQPGGVSRLALWLAAMMAYGLFWTALALRLETRSQSARLSIVVLGSVWLFVTILSPVAVNAILQAVYPVPPRALWINTARAAEQEWRLETASMSEEEQHQLLRELLDQNPTMEQNESLYKGSAFSRAVALATTLQAARELDSPRESFQGPLRAQLALLSKVRFVAPAVLLQGMLYDLAGAGPSRYEDFLGQTRRFQHEVEQWAWERRLGNAQMTSEQYASIPRFRYADESTEAALRLVVVPLAVLWALSLIVTVSALRASRRLAPL
jgi:ABC-2 type transport system permease protein